MKINALLLSLIFCTSAQLLSNPLKLDSMTKIAHLAGRMSPTQDAANASAEWLRLARKYPKQTLLYSCHFIEEVLVPIMQERLNMFLQFADCILAQENSAVLARLEEYNGGIGFLIRAMQDISQKHSPSVFDDEDAAHVAQMNFIQMLSEVVTLNNDFKRHFERSITPTEPIEIIRPRAVYPETATRQSSPDKRYHSSGDQL